MQTFPHFCKTILKFLRHVVKDRTEENSIQVATGTLLLCCCLFSPFGMNGIRRLLTANVGALSNSPSISALLHRYRLSLPHLHTDLSFMFQQQSPTFAGWFLIVILLVASYKSLHVLLYEPHVRDPTFRNPIELCMGCPIPVIIDISVHVSKR